MYNMYIHTHIHTRVYIHIIVYLYTYICVCTCVFCLFLSLSLTLSSSLTHALFRSLFPSLLADTLIKVPPQPSRQRPLPQSRLPLLPPQETISQGLPQLSSWDRHCVASAAQQEPNFRGKKTLVLDLDETLVWATGFRCPGLFCLSTLGFGTHERVCSRRGCSAQLRCTVPSPRSLVIWSSPWDPAVAMRDAAFPHIWVAVKIPPRCTV